MGVVCSSSVCRTCPQCPCCGFSTQAIVHKEIKHVLCNWFHRLCEVSPNMRLRDVTSLTAHDSGTYSIPTHTLGSSLSRTQSIDVYEQLNMGIRHIDFRYGPADKNSSEIVVVHGPHKGANYFKELIKVKNWLEDNPHEFLIISAQNERPINLQQKESLIKYFSDKFGKCLITSKDTDTWFRIEDVTLREIAQYHPKRVLLLVDDMILSDDKDGKLRREGFLHRDDFVVSKWHHTGNVKKIFTKIAQDAVLFEMHPDRFANLQLILTPELHLKALAMYCCCLDRSRVDQKHYLLFQGRQVQYFIRDLARGPLNFVMMDFVNYDPHINEFLIGINFPYRLNIIEGFAICSGKRVELTDALRRLVVRGNSLWIISIVTDLGIKSKNATLHLVYEYETGRTVHKIIEVKHGEQYLLNCISHLDVTLDMPYAEDVYQIEEFNRRRTFIFKEAEEYYTAGNDSSCLLTETPTQLPDYSTEGMMVEPMCPRTL